MRSAFVSLAVVVALFGGLNTARAQYPYYPYPQQARTNPDMMGPGHYGFNAQGAYSGPSYYVVPPNCPYVPNPYLNLTPREPRGGHHPRGKSYMSQPYVRSPRDFFMFHENLDAERSRDLRPQIVP